ncbi:uncharacterized protein YpfA [Paraliobacillus ryukyuensis]|uniref:C-di-GMP-binding flagellar brake protein YcgR n=1 Tax=Paraliobacillus ryukyuensis TaxID=200904 RepID=A0A366EGJ4_9BACI|nr:c-di-GMP-binding flagellar brake protein YcgR [Paraliobacillus ryukyuensis]
MLYNYNEYLFLELYAHIYTRVIARLIYKGEQQLIKIGIPLTLETIQNEEEHTKYRCKVVEQEESTIYIDYPINEKTGRTDIFPKGAEFSVSFIGKDEAVYQFFTEIKGKKQGNMPMLLLHYPKDKLNRIQRREYVRINSTLDIAVHDLSNEKEAYTSITKDISGGGLSVVLPNDQLQYDEEELVEILLVLPMNNGNTEYIKAKASVVRMLQKKDMHKPLLTLKFHDILEKDRQQIIRYCFEVQLRERRQRL